MYSFVVLKCGGFIKRVKRSKPFTIYVSPQCLQTTFAAKPGSFFPWAIYRCVLQQTFQRSNLRVNSTQAISPRGALEERSTATAPFIKIFLTVLANRLFCIWGFSRAQFYKRSATIPHYVANKCHERNSVFGTVLPRIFFTAISGRWQLFYFLFICLFL